MTEPFPEQDKIMAMDQFLAEYFGNTKTASVNDTTDAPDAEAEKTAQMELFCKLAAQNNIDLDSLSEDQIATLWNATFDGSEKTASEDDKGDKEKEKDSEGEDDKKEEAAKEHAEKKEAMAKMAEATFLGKVMAHSLVAELREISKEAEAADPGETQETDDAKEAGVKETAGKALGFLKNQGRKAVDDVKAVKDMHGKMGRFAKSESIAKQAPASGDTVARLQKAHDGAKRIRDAAAKRTAARAGGAAAVGVAGGAAASAGRKKESSAIDELALVAAVEKAAEAGWDPDQAAEKIAAVHTLNLLGESEKVAAAIDVDSAVEVRALEFLEAAGYPVTWES